MQSAVARPVEIGSAAGGTAGPAGGRAAGAWALPPRPPLSHLQGWCTQQLAARHEIAVLAITLEELLLSARRPPAGGLAKCLRHIPTPAPPPESGRSGCPLAAVLFGGTRPASEHAPPRRIPPAARRRQSMRHMWPAVDTCGPIHPGARAGWRPSPIEHADQSSEYELPTDSTSCQVGASAFACACPTGRRAV